MKRKLKWKRILLFILIIIVIIAGSVLIYKNTDYGKLRGLDYSSSVIKLMNSNTKKELIKEDTYSDVVTQALLQKKFVTKNLSIYLNIKYIDDKNYIKDVNKLVELKYTQKDIVEITKNLNINEITKLIKIGYVKDIISYVDISYFNIDNLERYVAYKTKSEKSYTSVITYVNIGLDKEYYDDEATTTVTDTDSILVWVSKYRKLPEKYEPTDLEKLSKECSSTTSYLRKEAAEAFEELCKAAIEDGQSVLAKSAYRSYATQQSTWDSYMTAYGSSYTYYYVAKPGYSEHQTGLALDLSSGTNPDAKFAYTSDYTWTINNAYKYGFIIRYEEGKEDITGYNNEPWHIRYVGKKVAKYITEQDTTFDEYMATYN